MDISQIRTAVDVFIKHRTEIFKAVGVGLPGQKVMAEVDNDGNWLGVQIVDPDVGSELEYKGEGYALFIDCDQFITRTTISDLIFDWEEQQFEKIRENNDIDIEIEYPRREYRDFDDDLFSRGR